MTNEDMNYEYNRMKEQFEYLHECLDFLGIPRSNLTLSGRVLKMIDYVPNLYEQIQKGKKDYEVWYGNHE